MIRKLLFTLCVIGFIGNAVMAQSTVKGVVTDPSGQPVAFLQVLLQSEGKIVDGSQTNDKGEYQIFNVMAGTYDIVAGGTMTCPNKTRQAGIYVAASEVKFINLSVNCQSNDIGEVVVKYKPPIFDADQTTSSTKLTGDAVRQTPGRSITAALNSTDGVSTSASGESFHRGNRPDGQQMIVDGVRVRGGSLVSMQSVEGAELIQGGVPAEYGDGTSFTVITTKGVAKTYNGSAEIRGSLDGYNNFLAAASVSGPIVKGKTDNDPAIMGFLLTAEVNYDQDASPARGGTWKATDETIANVAANPLVYDMDNLGAYTYTADYLTEESFYKQRVRDNARNWGYFVQGKIDLLAGAKDKNTGKSKNNVRLSVGGSYQYNKGNGWSQSSTMFMPTTSPNLGESISQTVRANVRLSHRVKTNASDSAILKNLMYDINVNYTNWTTLTQDAIHQDNIFHYGYIGKFKENRERMYTWYGDPRYAPEGALQAENWYDGYQIGESDVYKDVLVFSSYPNTFLEYTPGSQLGIDGFNPNTYLENYTNNFYNTFTEEFLNDYFEGDYTNYIGNYDKYLYQSFGALLNGDSPAGVYGMYSMPGVLTSGYGKSSNNSIGAKASLAMNLSNHEIKFGFDFEKLTYRSWSVSTNGLWSYMRQTQNWHMQEIDFSNPIFYTDADGVAVIDYNWLVNESDQKQFDRVIRETVGLDATGYDNQWIDIDSYDLSMYDALGVGMFSNQELMTGLSGNPLVSYSGYDYTGSKKYNETDKSQSIERFFGVVDPETGKMVYDFNIGAYEPIYMALYLQDKFSINTLLFNVGLRVDYFDANQQVLKDPFLFRDAYTVGELANHQDAEVQAAFADRFGNTPEDWVVYVNSKDKIAEEAGDLSIVGYRNGTQWFDATGKEVTDPTSILGATGGPVLKDALVEGAISKVSGKAFEDYNPWDKISFMPRISFSFPVSDVSLFYAHYNIITYRPTNLSLDPVSYLYIENNETAILNNPNLKPQKSIDYEIGFRQKVGNNSAISVAAYYSEKRDQIQTYRFTGAYPTTYYSFDNIDFGTVQGFTFGYNLRSKNEHVSLRANYTLQFAKGTGSDATSNAAIIASGQPNLRTLNNLSFDQRHRITANLDFRFGTGKNYKGPISQKAKEKDGKLVKKEIKWFENAGITFLASAASGMPYSRSSTASSAIAGRGKSSLQGSINGSNMPWIFQCDIRIDKSWTVNLHGNKKDKDGKAKFKPGYITAYLDVQNIFNFKNIVYVYDYTGSPEDDGYLSTSEGLNFLDQQVYAPAYENYYNMLMQNPYHYSTPARVNLGIQFGF